MSEGMMEPYGGPISFFRLPYAENAAGLDIAVMGIPFDLATTGRSGARMGPRAIREMSLTMAEFPWGVWPWDYHFNDKWKVADLGDVMGFTAYPDRMFNLVEEHADTVLAAGSALLTLGGDHSVTYPLLKAHAKKHGPLALIHFDAHSDTWESDDLNHGTMFYHAIKEGIILPEHSIQMGMRTPNPETMGMLVIDGNECLKTTAEALAKRIRERVGNQPAYLTFDIDFLDPAYAPATGTPVVGGPNVAYAREVLKLLAGLNIVGGDQVEVAPHYEGPGQITALAGATIAADILYLIGESKST
ncbi:agmatinase [Kordiimonas pumila]|uniref:Agmatinase n=1 Tax=Kordiimonas pumila TaxID=2161677 RepID=A0ABV7D2T8_9PROT|nr:agmatinase [Kordiimonas pumila]